jgi:hypothetical protein
MWSDFVHDADDVAASALSIVSVDGSARAVPIAAAAITA